MKDGICSGDQACELARSLARLITTGTLAIAATSTLSPQAKAQQENGATSPALSARPALRTDAASTFDIKIIAAIVSDYNFRGYTLSDHKPSISTNLEATYNILFAAVNAASVHVPMVSQLQMTNYAGIRPVFGPLTVETGVAYYSYPGSSIDISYPEYYVAPSYALSPKLMVSVNAYYAPNYSRTGAWENYELDRRQVHIRFRLSDLWRIRPPELRHHERDGDGRRTKAARLHVLEYRIFLHL